MGKGSKTVYRSASHQLFKDKAKNRVDDLQGMFSDLQSARKESRTADVAVLEEQVHQMLREWKAELNKSSPASSLLGNTHVSSELPSETLRLLQLSEEEDDATSKLAVPAPGKAKAEPLDVPEPNVEEIQGGETAAVFQEALKQKEENLAREIELLKQKFYELEHLAQGRGPFSIPKFRSGHAPESAKPMAAA